MQGGPREARWWKGRLTRRFVFVAGISSRPEPPPPSSLALLARWSPSPATGSPQNSPRAFCGCPCGGGKCSGPPPIFLTNESNNGDPHADTTLSRPRPPPRAQGAAQRIRGSAAAPWRVRGDPQALWRIIAAVAGLRARILPAQQKLPRRSAGLRVPGGGAGFPPANKTRPGRGVQPGAPRHLPPATAREKLLRHYPASNFTHD